MELNLHPIATKCCVSGREFAEGERVVCYLVREADGLTGRRDLLESEDANLPKPAEIYCRWVISYKPRKGEENADRALKMTAENLFLALADPLNPPNEANTPLLQFLALMLERKKILKPRGVSADGARNVYEHMRLHQMFEVPVGDLNAEFFVKIQGQLDVLVGSPKKKAPEGNAPAEAVATTDAPAAGQLRGESIHDGPMTKEQSTLRRAQREDAAQLARIAEETFRATFAAQNTAEDMALHCAQSYSEQIQAEEIGNPEMLTLVVEAGGRLVAFAQLRWGKKPECVPAESAGEIQRIYVARDWHGRGVAQKLMNACLEELARRGSQTVWLGVWEKNPRAIAFYRKFGFVEVGSHVFPLGRDPQRDLVLMRAVQS